MPEGYLLPKFTTVAFKILQIEFASDLSILSLYLHKYVNYGIEYLSLLEILLLLNCLDH